LEKLSADARVIFGVAALLENTPFELYTLIRSGSLIRLQAAARNASATMSRRTIWRSAATIGFAGLAAGARWIRTFGSATDPFRSRDSRSVSHRG